MTVGLILASVLPPTAEQQYMSYLSDDFVFKADADNGSSGGGGVSVVDYAAMAECGTNCSALAVAVLLAAQCPAVGAVLATPSTLAMATMIESAPVRPYLMAGCDVPSGYVPLLGAVSSSRAPCVCLVFPLQRKRGFTLVYICACRKEVEILSHLCVPVLAFSWVPLLYT